MEEVVSAFVAMLAKEGICYATIKTYHSAVCYFHIASGQGDPDIRPLGVCSKGNQERWSLQFSRASKGKIINYSSGSQEVVFGWKRSPTIRDAKMLWVAACLAFLQVGEFTSPGTSSFDEKVHLSVADISVDHPHSPSMDHWYMLV